jgi:hypothetical protein
MDGFLLKEEILSRKSTFLFAEKCTSLFAEKCTLLFTVYTTIKYNTPGSARDLSSTSWKKCCFYA